MGHQALRECDRCGHKTASQFCKDCRSVDPRMTEGGKTADQYAQERKRLREREHHDRISLYRLAGYNTERPHFRG